uniref:RRM domain-containing protein n=1 Tax=Physcomitrium patens TaxID=3218 RepID=A0A7I4BV32_PHYPA
MDSPRGRSRTPPYRYSDSPSPRRSSRGRSRSRTPPSRRDRSDVREDATNPGNNLYVTGLSTRVTEKDLDEHFSREGKVVECRLVVDPRTRESRGFGFVTMDNADDADRCVKYLNRSTLEGRIITVEKRIFDYCGSQLSSGLDCATRCALASLQSTTKFVQGILMLVH